MSCFCPGVSSQLDQPPEGVREASLPDTRTTSTGFFQCGGTEALLRLRVSPGCPSFAPCSSALAQRPWGENSFQPLIPAISFFLSLPKTHDHWWRLELKSTSKSPRQPSTMTILLLLHCLHAPTYPHLLTRSWGTWTPLLGETTQSLSGVGNPPFSSSESCPQIWRCSFLLLHTCCKPAK